MLVLALLFSIVPPASAFAQSAPPPPSGDVVPGELLVRFRSGTGGTAASDAHRRNGAVLARVLSRSNTHVVRVPPGREAAVRALYARLAEVAYVEPNGIYGATAHPTNDTNIGQQWQYNNTGQSGGTVDADIDAFEAWHVTTGSPAVKIAILDSGIDQDHPDLAGKIVANANFT